MEVFSISIIINLIIISTMLFKCLPSKPKSVKITTKNPSVCECCNNERVDYAQLKNFLDMHRPKARLRMQLTTDLIEPIYKAIKYHKYMEICTLILRNRNIRLEYMDSVTSSDSQIEHLDFQSYLNTKERYIKQLCLVYAIHTLSENTSEKYTIENIQEVICWEHCSMHWEDVQHTYETSKNAIFSTRPWLICKNLPVILQYAGNDAEITDRVYTLMEIIENRKLEYVVEYMPTIQRLLQAYENSICTLVQADTQHIENSEDTIPFIGQRDELNAIYKKSHEIKHKSSTQLSRITLSSIRLIIQAQDALLYVLNSSIKTYNERNDLEYREIKEGLKRNLDTITETAADLVGMYESKE